MKLVRLVGDDHFGQVFITDTQQGRVEKLFEKYARMETELCRYETENLKGAEVVFVAFGTTARICREACEILASQGIKAGLIRPISLWPFPNRAFDEIDFGTTKAVISAELSMGQMITDVRLALNGRLPVYLAHRTGGMVPTYMVIRALGWVGTPWALVIPGCTNSMYCIMMMNAFNSIPKEMYEASHIDGAGHLSTLFEITLPQAMNMGSVIILNLVIGQWNSWLQASIYVPNKKALWPLQLVIRQITSENADFLNSSNPNYSRYLIQFAVIIAAIAPIIIAFPFFQDKMEKGVIQGGVKG